MSEINSDTARNVFGVLKKALWNTGSARADEAVYEELKKHTVAALAAPVLQELNLPDDLLKKWEINCVRTFAIHQRCQMIQESLPISVPYVILKGTSAAQYYPHPEFRAMGDIDIMTSHEDYQTACENMLLHGCQENTDAVYKLITGRHREFLVNGVELEIHSFYALRDSIEETKALDDLIIDHIGPDHVLPDLINGLTLIEHVNCHLDSGLGLRQIIDWMMFVDRCLPDDRWPEFEELAKRTGHVTLARVVTRMCEIYLGLSEHAWCRRIDPAICEALMEYVYSCGNFGQKKQSEHVVSERLLSSSSWLSVFKSLEHHGVLHWKAAQKYRFLMPFAWVRQTGKYMLRGITRKNPVKKIKEEYKNSKKQKELFDNIGLSREKKGRVIFLNGEYIHNKK